MHRHAIRFLAFVALCGAQDTLTSAAEPVPEAASLIEQLDDDRFAVRERAERLLIERGESCLPAVVAALGHPSAEVRTRAQRVIGILQERALDRGFEALARQPEEEFDLEQGLWLVSRMLHPQCQRDELSAQLDALAAQIKELLGEVHPAQADPRRVVEAFDKILFQKEEFRGNTADYQNPSNSSLEDVLRTRQGLPILLSQVVVLVARRLDVPIVGLALPVRYMVKYDGARAPAGFPKEDLFIDPYGARVLTLEEVEEVVSDLGASIDPAEHLRPASQRATFLRVLSNFISHLSVVGKEAEASRAMRYRRWIEEDR